MAVGEGEAEDACGEADVELRCDGDVLELADGEPLALGSTVGFVVVPGNTGNAGFPGAVVLVGSVVASVVGVVVVPAVGCCVTGLVVAGVVGTGRSTSRQLTLVTWNEPLQVLLLIHAVAGELLLRLPSIATS